MRNIVPFLTEGLQIEDETPFDTNLNSDRNVETQHQVENNISDISPIVSQIRKLALDGISKFASQTETNEYQFFKKIFLECDKAISNKSKENISSEN